MASAAAQHVVEAGVGRLDIVGAVGEDGERRIDEQLDEASAVVLDGKSDREPVGLDLRHRRRLCLPVPPIERLAGGRRRTLPPFDAAVDVEHDQLGGLDGPPGRVPRPPAATLFLNRLAAGGLSSSCTAQASSCAST